MNVFCTITAAQNGGRVPLTVESDCTPLQLRQQVSDTTKIPLESLRLIFRGRMIKDDTSLKVIDEYKLEENCVLHCMGKPATESSSAAATSTAAAAAVPTSTPAVAVPTPALAGLPSVAAAAAATAPTTTTTVDPLQVALTTLKTSNPPSVYATAIATLDKLLNNIATHPMEEKYRQVKMGNAAFQKRLGGVAGGDAVMKAVGFVVQDEVYQLVPSPEAWPKLMASKATVEAVAKAAKQQQQQQPQAAAPLAAAANPFAGGGMGGGMMPGMGGMPGMMPGMGGMPPGGMPDMNDPMVRNAVTNMMSNPEALRNMLQNPMIRQMIQNDPNVPPMMRQSMEQLANNPAMLDQLTTMMRDPAMQAQLSQAMAQGGGGMPGMGVMPGMGGMMMPPNINNPPGNNNAPANNSAGSSSGGSGANDQTQTEEEMIAEAIRRSLEES